MNQSVVGWRHLYLLLRANCAHLVISKMEKSPPSIKIIIQNFLHVRNIPVNLLFSSNYILKNFYVLCLFFESVCLLLMIIFSVVCYFSRSEVLYEHSSVTQKMFGNLWGRFGYFPYKW